MNGMLIVIHVFNNTYAVNVQACDSRTILITLPYGAVLLPVSQVLDIVLKVL